MTYEEFIASCSQGTLRKDTPGTLRALCIDKSGDWDGAHTVAQSIGSKDGSWVHAYLHRKEGDLSNAGYWYARAQRTMPTIDLTEEWEAIARELTQ